MDRQWVTYDVDPDQPVLLALDPGETTGYAVMLLEPLLDSEQMPILVEHGVISRWRGINKILNVYNPDAVVVEKFLLYPWKAKEQAFSDMAPVQVIGVVEYLAEERSIPVVQQPAQVAKAVKISQELRSAIRNSHAIDAVCHGIAYLRTVKRAQSTEREP